MLEGWSQPTGAYIFYTIYLFHTIFLINLLLPFLSLLHMPLNFLIFVTPLHDPILRLHSRLPFATHIHNPHLRLTVFATPLSCDSTTDGQTVIAVLMKLAPTTAEGQT